MNTIKGGLFDRLRFDAAVYAIAGDRIYPQPAPRTAVLPYISFQRIDKMTERHMRGPNNYARARFQFNCWAATPDEADALAEAVRRSIDGLNHTTLGLVTVDDIAFIQQRDTVTNPTDASESPEAVCQQDYWVHYREELPAHVAAV